MVLNDNSSLRDVELEADAQQGEGVGVQSHNIQFLDLLVKAEMFLSLEQLGEKIKSVQQGKYQYDDVVRMFDKLSEYRKLSLVTKEVSSNDFINAISESLSKFKLELGNAEVSKNYLFVIALLDAESKEWSSITFIKTDDDLKAICINFDYQQISDVVESSLQNSAKVFNVKIDVEQSTSAVVSRVSKAAVDLYMDWSNKNNRFNIDLDQSLSKISNQEIDQEIDQENALKLVSLEYEELYYGRLISELFLQKSEASKKALITTFSSMGNLYVDKAKISKNPEYYTEAAKFYQYVLSISNNETSKAVDTVTQDESIR